MDSKANGNIVDLVDRYIAMWNETDAGRRRSLIRDGDQAQRRSAAAVIRIKPHDHVPRAYCLYVYP